MKRDTFDIENFENNKENEHLEYFSLDGSFVEISRIKEYECFVMRIAPPLPKFYRIYKEYYLNGKLKKFGYHLYNMIMIGKWHYYDEQGNETIKDEDLKFGKFNYNKVFLFLAREGIVNLQTGEGRERLSFGYDKEEMMWYVTVNPTKDYSDMGCSYRINSKTGKVKKVRLVNNE